MRAKTNAQFLKNSATWRSRFNLPFKVNMAGEEVAIDGVSLRLPRNPYRISSGFMATENDKLYLAVFALRLIEFRTFDIEAEVTSFNEAIKIFSEPVR